MQLIPRALLVAILGAAPPALAADGAAFLRTPPPSPDDAAGFAASFTHALAQGEVDEAWVQAHIDPGNLPGPLSDDAVADYLERLQPDTVVGRLLREEPPVYSTANGPNYVRVVYDTQPSLSVRIRRANESDSSDEPLFIDALELTTCSGCSERERWVRDLLADVQATGGENRLLPGVELEVAQWVQRAQRTRDVRWVSAWTQRRGGRNLAILLEGAQVHSLDGDTVRVALADDVLDTWRIVWSDERWKLDYGSLADDSPLRLSAEEATRRASRQLQWVPSFREEAGAVILGTGITGIAVDPLHDEVLAVVLDVDGRFHELVHLDPISRSITHRVDLPDIDTYAPSDVGWFTSWHVAGDLRGSTVAASIPRRVLTIDAEEGVVHSRPRSDATALAVLDGGTWVADARGGLQGPDDRRYVHDAPLVALAPGHRSALRADGAIVDPFQPNAPPVAHVCSGQATGGALAPDGAVWAVACGEGAERTVAFVGIDGTGVFSVAGPSSPYGAVAWSPDGSRVAVAAGVHSEVNLYNGRGEVVRRLGRDVRQIAWLGDGALVTAHIDGTVRLWSP